MMLNPNLTLLATVRIFLVIIVVSSCEPRAFNIPTPAMEATIPVGSRVAIIDTQPERNDVIVFKYPYDPEVYYIFRMVAIAGDSLRIHDSKLFVNQALVAASETIQFRHQIETDINLRERFFEENNISVFSQTNKGFLVHSTTQSAEELKKFDFVKSLTRLKNNESMIDPRIYKDFRHGNPDFLGPIYIPKKGDKISGEDLKRYAETIRYHEGVDVNSVNEYVFQNSYCFVMGDSRDNAEDSRYIGLIPMQNVVGKGTVWYKPG